MAFQGMGPATFGMNRMQAALDDVRKTAAGAVSSSEAARAALEAAQRSIAELSASKPAASNVETDEIRAFLVRLEDSVAQAREDTKRASTAADKAETEVQAAHKLAKEAKTEAQAAHKLAKETKANQGKIATEMEQLKASWAVVSNGA